MDALVDLYVAKDFYKSEKGKCPKDAWGECKKAEYEECAKVRHPEKKNAAVLCWLKIAQGK